MEKSVLKQINKDLRTEISELKEFVGELYERQRLSDVCSNQMKHEKAMFKEEYAKLVIKDKLQVKALNGLCDTLDAKDAKLKKAIREGIAKLELRDKLLNIFNVVVKD